MVGFPAFGSPDKYLVKRCDVLNAVGGAQRLPGREFSRFQEIPVFRLRVSEIFPSIWLFVYITQY